MNVLKTLAKGDKFEIGDEHINGFLSHYGTWHWMPLKVGSSWKTKEEATAFLESYKQKMSKEQFAEWCLLRITDTHLTFGSTEARSKFNVNMGVRKQ